MDMNHTQKVNFKFENDNGDVEVKGEIYGESQIPFFDDLKFKAVIALLNSIDQQNFNDSGNSQIFNLYIREIEETIKEMRNYNQFQEGKLGKS
ncbi:hypothetical protein [Neobacillus mesonae]|uniref:Uncharacterized protein n=1 Tax=Neobacillus mesonae TaxID=1193713 RepID=A0A3Q9QUZ1_9BACI|nr:hypothetical protein [Neobacillus mesonae]AZU62336.1 hypothetical protein CHR53_14155 [Neobacillus mesonae]